MKKHKLKMKIHHASTIDESIDDLHMFLDCDMYSKFRPEHIIQGQKMYRQDFFINEKEFKDYLTVHFKILKAEIKRIKGKHESKEKKK